MIFKYIKIVSQKVNIGLEALKMLRIHSDSETDTSKFQENKKYK